MTPASPFTFHRPAIAAQLADALTGQTLFDYRSGLFLAAPRRTGKTTFLRMDLVPLLKRRGLETLYVDLWSEKTSDPAELIADVIKDALRSHDNPALRAVKAVGLSKISLGPVASFDIEKIGTPNGVTLSDALKALAKRAGKPIALIVDEAQHALTSAAGVNAMFALKAARDAMNIGSDSQSLTLVFTGSHRDKLSNLMLRRDQPFFGASYLEFPLLGQEYSDAYTQWLNQRLASDNQLDPGDVYAAFKTLGFRPEMLQNALKDFALGPTKSDGLKRSLAEGAHELRERLWEDYDRDFSQLTALQKAALGQLIRDGDKFAPFARRRMAEQHLKCPHRQHHDLAARRTLARLDDLIHGLQAGRIGARDDPFDGLFDPFRAEARREHGRRRDRPARIAPSGFRGVPGARARGNRGHETGRRYLRCHRAQNADRSAMQSKAQGMDRDAARQSAQSASRDNALR